MTVNRPGGEIYHVVVLRLGKEDEPANRPFTSVGSAPDTLLSGVWMSHRNQVAGRVVRVGTATMSLDQLDNYPPLTGGASTSWGTSTHPSRTFSNRRNAALTLKVSTSGAVSPSTFRI